MIIFSLSPLRARKSNNYFYRYSWKSDNFREGHKKKKQGTDNKKDAKDNFTRSNREKSNIAFAIFEIKMIGWHHK